MTFCDVAPSAEASPGSGVRGVGSTGSSRFRVMGARFVRVVPGGRMAERAAHLVDHVFPRVPVRQWVLSLPYRLRYRLAWDHALCRAVVGRTMRAILGFHRRRARSEVVRDALRRQLSLMRFERTRRRLAPYVARGYLTDEDVFRDVS